MFKMKNLIIISLIFSIGCSAKKGHFNKFYSEWESSGSPCVDALTVNLNSSGCEEVRIAESEKPLGKTIYCVKSREVNMWTLSGFFVVTEDYQPEMLQDDLYPFCFDSQTSIFFFELD